MESIKKLNDKNRAMYFLPLDYIQFQLLYVLIQMRVVLIQTTVNPHPDKHAQTLKVHMIHIFAVFR